MLVQFVPGAEPSGELRHVRGMLDAHMFGRDKRLHRDAFVEVARQIDQIVPLHIRLRSPSR